MSLTINKEMLGPAYDYLRATKPFSRWKLPAADEVIFGIIPNKDRSAHYYCRKSDGRHVIECSSHWNTRHVVLLSSLAHEMAHLHLNLTGRHSSRNPHNAEFWRLADRICKNHVEFDRAGF